MGTDVPRMGLTLSVLCARGCVGSVLHGCVTRGHVCAVCVLCVRCVCAVCVLCVCHVLRVLCAIGVAVLCTGGLHTCTYVLCVCYVCAMYVLCVCCVCAV